MAELQVQQLMLFRKFRVKALRNHDPRRFSGENSQCIVITQIPTHPMKILKNVNIGIKVLYLKLKQNSFKILREEEMSKLLPWKNSKFMQIFRLRKYLFWRISLDQGSWERRRRTRRKLARGTSLSRLISSSASFDSETLLSSLELVLFGTRFGSGTRRLAWGEFYQGSLKPLTPAHSNRVVSGIESSRPVPRRIGCRIGTRKSPRRASANVIVNLVCDGFLNWCVLFSPKIILQIQELIHPVKTPGRGSLGD